MVSLCITDGQNIKYTIVIQLQLLLFGIIWITKNILVYCIMIQMNKTDEKVILICFSDNTNIIKSIG